MWIRLTSREENWRSIGETPKYDVPVLIRTGDIIALKGIPPEATEENKTLVYIKATSPDGWLEFSVTESVDDILSKIA